MAAAEQELTPTSYIGHHLTNRTVSLGDGAFWTLHLDTLLTAVVLGIVGFGFLWWIARGATAGVPNKRQAFVEMLFDFVEDQVKGIFHGNRAFVAPLAFTVGVWVLLMNAMDFIPVDHAAWFTTNVLQQHEWKPVPTSDVNTTFGLALSVWALMIFYNIKVKGIGGWTHELFCTPFGSFFRLWPLNFLFKLVESISSRCPIRCGCTAISTQAKSFSCCCGCGLPPALSARWLAACSRWAGQFSIFLSWCCKRTFS